MNAADVRELAVVELESDVLDCGDDGIVAVDGSPSSRTSFGAFGAVDGSGYAVGGWFDCPPGLLDARFVSKASVCELQALRMGLRDYPDGSRVMVVMDSRDAAELLTLPLSEVHRTPIYRQFPQGAREVIEHRRRLAVRRRFDFSEKRGAAGRPATVGQHPLMVAAHRLAYALHRLSETGSRVSVQDERWLLDLIENPGNKHKNVKRFVDMHLDGRRRVGDPNPPGTRRGRYHQR